MSSAATESASSHAVELPWHAAPATLRLDRGDVHVWRLRLAAPSLDLDTLQQSLSADERVRAARFIFAKDRQAFVATRGLLRRLLARYLDGQPTRLCFHYGEHGKPTLDAGGDLRFNVSHSHGLALIAIARGREVGVDVEYVRDDIDCERIAQRFFSAREAAALRALPEALTCRAFFVCWARKEAFVKATGEGIGRALSSFEVSCAAHDAAALPSVGGDPYHAAGWSICDLFPDPAFTAAVVAEGQGWRPTCYCWA